MNCFNMVHNSLESSTETKDGVLSSQLVMKYLGLPMNCADSKYFAYFALTKVSLSCNSLVLLKISAVSVEFGTYFLS